MRLLKPSAVALLIEWRNQLRRCFKRHFNIRATRFTGFKRERIAHAYHSSKNSAAEAASGKWQMPVTKGWNVKKP